MAHRSRSNHAQGVCARTGLVTPFPVVALATKHNSGGHSQLQQYDFQVPHKPEIQENRNPPNRTAHCSLVQHHPTWKNLQHNFTEVKGMQGRLESLLNFQTMVADLTGMEMSNASLLDEATAAAEAMTMASAIARGKKPRFLVASNCHPQTIAVCQSRADGLGIIVDVVPVDQFEFAQDVCGALVQVRACAGTTILYCKAIVTASAPRTCDLLFLIQCLEVCAVPSN